MSNTPTRNISLTAELDSYIRALVASGRYSNASEVVRAGLRLLIAETPHEKTQHGRAAAVTNGPS